MCFCWLWEVHFLSENLLMTLDSSIEKLFHLKGVTSCLCNLLCQHGHVLNVTDANHFILYQNKSMLTVIGCNKTTQNRCFVAQVGIKRIAIMMLILSPTWTFNLSHHFKCSLTRSNSCCLLLFFNSWNFLFAKNCAKYGKVYLSLVKLTFPISFSFTRNMDLLLQMLQICDSAFDEQKWWCCTIKNKQTTNSGLYKVKRRFWD